MVATVLGIVSFGIGVVYRSVSILFSVSRNQVSLSQGLEVSVYHGVKVLECAVKILAHSFGESTLLLDFGTLRQNVRQSRL
jgi:hypothetical protein